MDSVKSHQEFINKHNLNFILLSDSEGKICKEYGVLGVRKKTGKEGIIRTTFVINEDGKIMQVYPKVKVQGHVEEILAMI